MSEQQAGAQPTIWVGLSASAAAGYARDSDGTPRLAAVIVYSPTAEAMRGIRIAGLDLLTLLASGGPVFTRKQPPTPDELLDGESRRAAKRRGSPSLVEIAKQYRESLNLTEDMISPAAAERVERATAPGLLQRRSGEPAGEFYARIRAAHDALSRVTDKPTTELARRAGVPVGTAAAWVSRAKSIADKGEQ